MELSEKKHVTFMENQFRGISVIGNNRNTPPANNGNDVTLVIPLPVGSPTRTNQLPTTVTTVSYTHLTLPTILLV